MDLPDLSPEIGTLLIKLPYRVGLFVSMSDDTGGGTSDEAELLALENALTYYVEDFCKSEFAQAIMLETLQNKHDWSAWKNDLHLVPEECRQVFDALLDQLDMKDIVAFKNNLLEIGITVAMAYREVDDTQSPLGKAKVFIALIIERLKLSFKGESLPSVDQMLNISRAEKVAINALADTLGIQYKVG